jgi:PTH1 family peptidyl-tRNA hydrolase
VKEKAKTGKIQLIVGLGNPGSEYASTRHNVGAWFIDAFCRQHRLTLRSETKFNAKFTSFSILGHDVKIMIPNTYMNHSGQAVSAVAKYYQIPVENIIIVHDELDLPVETIRFKTGGGHGGHNGLRDIIHHIHSREFHRLRIGIDHPGHKDGVVDYVLQKPSKADEQKIQIAIENGLRVMNDIIVGNFQAAMQKLHTSTDAL